MSNASDYSVKSDSHSLIEARGKNTLYILFSGTTKKNGLFDFWKVGNELDGSVLFVNDGSKGWYQKGVEGLGGSLDETLSTIQAIKKAVGAKQIVTVGLSMGGYGAALFAARLDALCISFGLDTRLKIAGSRSAKAMAKSSYVESIDLIEEFNASKGRFTIYTGEMDIPDLYSAHRVAHLPNVDVHYLKGVGHGVAPFIKDSYGLVELVQEIASGNPSPYLECETKSWDASTVEFLWKSKVAFDKGDLAGAKTFATAANVLSPISEVPLYLLGLVSEKTESWIDASAYLSQVVCRLPYFVGATFKLANAYRKLGQTEAALDMYRKTIELRPSSGLALYWFSRLMTDKGFDTDAMFFLELALQEDPEKELFKRESKRLKERSLNLHKSLPFFREGDSCHINDGTDSANSIIWIRPTANNYDELLNSKSIYILSVDKHSFFKSRVANVDVGEWIVQSTTYDKKRGLIRLDLQTDSKLVIPRSSLRFCVKRDSEE